jgi:UDP-N-acetylglucosamine 4,6-dehydratase/5-epimerase
LNFYNSNKLKFIIGDVRDKDRLSMAMRGVDYVFHLSALKHVPICEENPWEAVLTNIYGTRNVIEVAIENKVKKVIDISTDKAVDPFNLYGVTKACGEKLMIAANIESNFETAFVCIRAGNVLGTNGSVVPLFRQQILKNNEITITDERMSRYLMTLRQAIQLIFRATHDSLGGEIFVVKMPSANLVDLASVLIEKLGDKNTAIKKIGIRPGEKLYEVLVSRYESPRTIEYGEYFIILPHLHMNHVEEKYKEFKRINLEEYNSQNTHLMSREEITKLLSDEGWLSNKIERHNVTYYNKELTKEELKNIFIREGWQK